ncbi:MAG: NHL repeat-containing protein, partial [Gammaproteobacteria bacterium]
GASTIQKITPEGHVTTFAGTTVDGSKETGSGLEFKPLSSLAADQAGNIYAADTDNNVIWKITSAGVVTLFAGSPGKASENVDGVGANARFHSPHGVATDTKGNVYLADSGNNSIRKITPAGEVTTIVGQPAISGFLPGALPGQLASPTGITIHGTTLYITTEDAVVQVKDVP